MYTVLSAIVFHLNWKRNGSADCDEVWQEGRLRL